VEEKKGNALRHLLLSLLPLRVCSSEHGGHGGRLVVRGSSRKLDGTLSSREGESMRGERKKKGTRDEGENTTMNTLISGNGERDGTRPSERQVRSATNLLR
jgi:hypothetical protein